jgi:hypothetical protein
MRERSNHPGGILDALLGGFGQALADIRGKLIDEGWFGRRAAPPRQFDVSPLGWERAPERDTVWTDRTGVPTRQTFEELWAPRERAEQPGEMPGHGELGQAEMDR